MKKFVWYFFIILLVLFGFRFICFTELGGLDQSWVYALNNIQINGDYIFGKDVFFTYGPLGYLMYPVASHAVVWKALLFIIFLISSFLFALFGLKINDKADVFLGLITISAIYLQCNMYEFLPVLLSAVCLYGREKFKYPSFILLNLTALLMLFVKFNLGVIYIATLVCLLIVSRFKHALTSALIWIVGLFCAIHFYFGDVSVFINWFKVTFNIASGFSEAMLLWRYAIHQIYLVLAFIIIGLYFNLWLKHKEFSKLFFVMLPAVFFTFKAGFVRADMHMLAFFNFILLIVPLLYLTVKDISVKKLCIMYIYALVLPVQCISSDCFVTSVIKSVKAQKTDISYEYTLPKQWVEKIGNSKVEILPIELLYLEKNNLNAHFNPILQLYSVYTKSLDDLSAQNYKDKKTDYIIIDNNEDIDRRNMIFDTPATWDAIRENYSIVSCRSGKILLSKLNNSKQFKYETFETDTYKFNETINIPPQAKKAVIKMDLSLSGKIANFIFKILPVFVDVNYGNNEITKIRFTRPTAVNGIYIDEFVETNFDMYNWLSDKPVGKNINSVKFYTKMPLLYKRDFRIEWQQ